MADQKGFHCGLLQNSPHLFCYRALQKPTWAYFQNLIVRKPDINLISHFSNLIQLRKLFSTTRVELASKLTAHGVKVTGVPSSNFLSRILSWALPILIFYLIWTYDIRRMVERQGFGCMMAIGKSRAKVYVETDTKVTFRDVAGVGCG